MATEIIWEFRGKIHLLWLQWPGGDHTEAWLSEPCVKGGAGKSQSLHSKLHTALVLQEDQMCSSVTGDSEGTPLVGLKLLTPNIKLTQPGVSEWIQPADGSQSKQWQVTAILPVPWGHLPASPGRKKLKRVSANWNLLLQAVWTEWSQVPHWELGHETNYQRSMDSLPTSTKGLSVESPCHLLNLVQTGVAMHTGTHVCSIGVWVCFLIHESIMQHTYSSHSSSKSQVGKLPFQFYLQSCTNLFLVSLESSLAKNQEQCWKSQVVKPESILRRGRNFTTQKGRFMSL